MNGVARAIQVTGWVISTPFMVWGAKAMLFDSGDDVVIGFMSWFFGAIVWGITALLARLLRPSS